MARNRPDTKLFLIHCSATRAKQDIGVRTINGWHEKRGIYSERGLTGYHFVIRRSGVVEQGRELREIGAHALGYNDVSVGICLVGGVDRNLEPEANFTPEQEQALADLLKVLIRIYPAAHIAPHNAVSNKACPSFDVWTWLEAEFHSTNKLAALAAIARIDNG